MSLLTIITVLQLLLRQMAFAPTKDMTAIDNASCPDVENIDNKVRSYMRRYGFAGAQLAVMKNDMLIYAKGYGWADIEAEEKMSAGNIMRVASVSKLVTAIGIMRMQEMGLLKLSDKVFAPNGPLGREEFTGEICDHRMLDITIEHLLRHQAGFSSRRGDLMFMPGNTEGTVAVRKSLKRRLAFTPGTSQEYSNMGFYLLSMIIEKLGHDSYENWMKRNVLQPMHLDGFRIAGNYLEDRYPGEVHYYMHEGSPLKPDYHLNGELVDGCYGANNVTGLSGAGAWVTNAAMLCRMVAGINMDWGIKDFLKPESVKQMTEYFDERTFSLGWNDTNPEGVWTRTGSFGGTTAIIKYFRDDSECWVLITNTSTYMGPRIAKHSAELISRLRNFTSELPTKDLFYQ